MLSPPCVTREILPNSCGSYIMHKMIGFFPSVGFWNNCIPFYFVICNTINLNTIPFGCNQAKTLEH
jgi:hypothetical protein